MSLDRGRIIVADFTVGLNRGETIAATFIVI